ncbi:MAG: ergothioneine biosynthesis protein EgtB [Acidobacteriaceae bacterium]
MGVLEASPFKTSYAALARRFHAVRAMTDTLSEPLTLEDQMVQSCPEASPVKWHLAHTTWFFETFILQKHLRGYQSFNPDFSWLFNSYYNSLGDPPEKRLRASFSRPPGEQIVAYRQHVERGIGQLLAIDASPEIGQAIELGMHHEQQHQELIATDIKHAFWSNPLQPTYAPSSFPEYSKHAGGLAWRGYAGGLVEIGHHGDGFAFDNEFSHHQTFLTPYRLASRLVTCAEYLNFIEDKGYHRPELWLSDGWTAIQTLQWQAPLYWRREPSGQGQWDVFTLRGMMPLDALLSTPVCHLSYYEADAYARWAGYRLPSEFEWEHAANAVPVSGNLLESGLLHPLAESGHTDSHLPSQMFGDVWEWTRSPYVAYPGYRSAPGALGEYNGKFMCNQFVLRGGSAVTPISHIRASYRNFFAPATRWQFSGLRLAADGDAE